MRTSRRCEAGPVSGKSFECAQESKIGEPSTLAIAHEREILQVRTGMEDW
jgi:hypothetical protein